MPYCFSRSYVKLQGHTALKIVEFDPDWAFPDCNSSFNSPMATKWCTKLAVALKRCPIVFQGHPSNTPRGQSSVVGGLKWWLSRGVNGPSTGRLRFGWSSIGIGQILAHLVSRVSRPQFCWGLAILCDPPFFSGYVEFGGVVVKFYSSVEITLYLLAVFLLQYVTLFQSRDIVKNLVSL